MVDLQTGRSIYRLFSRSTDSSFDLPIVRSTNSKIIQSQPIVAVFTGGTNGIGEYSVRTLAAQHGATSKSLRVYIVGRNDQAASKIVADCLAVCLTGEFIFVKATDLSPC